MEDEPREAVKRRLDKEFEQVGEVAKRVVRGVLEYYKREGCTYVRRANW
jgi:hypothetical protein